MSKYTVCSAKIDDYQNQFHGSSTVDGTDDIQSLFDPQGDQIAILIRNSASNSQPTLIECDDATGVLVSGENSMDVDVLIDRIQNCLREAEYDFTTNPQPA